MREIKKRIIKILYRKIFRPKRSRDIVRMFLKTEENSPTQEEKEFIIKRLKDLGYLD